MLQLPEAAWSTTTLVARGVNSPRTRFSPLVRNLGNQLTQRSKKESSWQQYQEQSVYQYDSRTVPYLATIFGSMGKAIVRGRITHKLLQLPGKCMCHQGYGISVLLEVGVVPLPPLLLYKGQRDRATTQERQATGMSNATMLWSKACSSILP